MYGPEQPGLIIGHYGASVDVEADDGQIFRCQQRQNLDPVIAGDKVIWQVVDKHSGVVNKLLPRTSVLGRPDKRGQIKPIAANVDQVFIVIALKPKIIDSLLDSYLVAAESLSMNPKIIINKKDLLTGNEAADFSKLAKRYEAIGYDVIHTSAKTQGDLGALNQHLSKHISIFVGQSGVGKSSLINTILPNKNIRVGALSHRTGEGRHTTTSSFLYHLEQGGCIIDSPGIREFGLWHMSSREIANGFVEFRPYIRECKFRDCKHSHEPHCAVREALLNSEISRERYNSYLQLISSE